MSSLPELPLELILEIVSYVTQSHNNNNKATTLKSLCLTCKLLRNAVHPVLLESIAVLSPNEKRESLKQLLQTIINHPKIATNAKSLSLGLEVTAAPDSEDSPAEATEVTEPAFELMHRLVNIRSLHLQGRRFIPGGLAQHPGRQITLLHKTSLENDPPVFSKLQDLRISAPGIPNTEPRPFINIAEYAAFFEHPTLQTLAIEHGLAYDVQNQIARDLLYRAHEKMQWGFDHLPSAALTITKLQLRECSFTTGTLTQFVAAFKCLRVFQYISMNRVVPYNSLAWPLDHPTDNPPMPPHEIADALVVSKDTLEELYLDLRPWYGPKDYPIDGLDSYYAVRELNEYTGFEKFTRLKHLDVEAELFPTTSAELPPNLETLVLRHCDVVGHDMCSNLVCGLSKEEFPSLRTIHVEGQWEDDSEIQQLEFTAFDCTGKGVERTNGCCFLCPMLEFDIVIRNTARHTDTSDDWRFS